MPSDRKQLNVEIDAGLFQRCKIVAQAEGKSLNKMVEEILARSITEKRASVALEKVTAMQREQAGI